ncbi:MULTISPECIES: hypothetical protein [Nocardia]|uniref:Uncharacterized protein n=1 Tax=Nocardia iowensis TaxID=204891 RepID=A0ABX8RQ15_NOCIO|nr:hypothetical protein [Nocardia iowensis]QXN89536.1 hypothetical protein KV110_29110 [Nocardia iowensis]
MLDIAYRKSAIDQDTQRLDISRYLARGNVEDPVRRSRQTQRIADDLDQPDQKASA